MVQREELTHLPEEVFVGKRIDRELVSQEAANHVFGKCEGMQRYERITSDNIQDFRSESAERKGRHRRSEHFA